jgi:biopolymer transport protein ExbD
MSINVQQARSIIRKAVKRVPEGEAIRHLNIMPMMDMMTMLLVAFIFQVSTGAEAIQAGAVDLPDSVFQEEMPEASTVVIITDKAIVIEGKVVAAVRNGDVDASAKVGGATGRQILKLSKFLAALRRENEAKMKREGKTPPKQAELMIVADRTTPFKLLLLVMNSARIGETEGKEDGGEYKRFRFITLKAGSLAGS